MHVRQCNGVEPADHARIVVIDEYLPVQLGDLPFATYGVMIGYDGIGRMTFILPSLH